jgi:hypothetical protein
MSRVSKSPVRSRKGVAAASATTLDVGRKKNATQTRNRSNERGSRGDIAGTQSIKKQTSIQW